MQTEFYRSQTDLPPTFSLVLAASLVALNSTANVAMNRPNGAPGSQPPMAHYEHAYYGRPDQMADKTEQIAALRRFAETLLKETEDSPQAVVEILNRHFWDLV
jgi:hypothetical protein